MPPHNDFTAPAIGASARRYLAEAAVVALLMMAIGAGALILEHPASWLRQLGLSELMHRLLMGTGVGITIVLLTYCPWGQISGAQLNPAVTLALVRVRQLPWSQARGYMLAQVLGALFGMSLMTLIGGPLFAHPAIGYATTTFDPQRWAQAFATEMSVTFVLMSLILACSRSPRLKPWTGVVAGVAMVIFVVAAAPISGVSMNPARSLASAAMAGELQQLWLYFIAPPIGTMLAAELHRRLPAGVPKGIRTPVAAVKGRCPRPD